MKKPRGNVKGGGRSTRPNTAAAIRKALASARRAGVVRARDLERQGVPRAYLKRLESQGLLVRESRGLYSATGAPVTEHHSLVEAAKRVPRGVVCLLSALRFHKIGTQNPHQVWIAIGEKAWRPRVDRPPLRVVRFSGTALASGVQIHEIEDVPVRIYEPAKTVADCFKYRNKIGLDVALEALRDCWRRKLCTMDDLWRYARICRVAKVMRPYLESLV